MNELEISNLANIDKKILALREEIEKIKEEEFMKICKEFRANNFLSKRKANVNVLIATIVGSENIDKYKHILKNKLLNKA